MMMGADGETDLLGCPSSHAGNLYAYGGLGVSGNRLDSVEVYTVDKGWTVMPNLRMCTPDAYFASALINV